MRENRTSGSEGGEPVRFRLSYPYQQFMSRPAVIESSLASELVDRVGDRMLIGLHHVLYDYGAATGGSIAIV